MSEMLACQERRRRERRRAPEAGLTHSCGEGRPPTSRGSRDTSFLVVLGPRSQGSYGTLRNRASRC